MSLLLLLFLTRVQTQDQVQTQVQVEVEVSLGQSLDLNCSGNADQTYWFMEVHSGLQVCISKNLDDKDSSDFFTFGKSEKFSVEGNKLKINNITEQDLRLYSCAKRKDKEKKLFHEAFNVRESYKLTTNLLKTAQNVTETCQDQNQDQNQTWTWRNLHFLVSLVLNVVFIVIIGLLVQVLCLKRRGPNRTSEPSPETPQAQDPALDQNPMYEEINLLPEASTRPSPGARTRPSPKRSPGARTRPSPRPSPRVAKSIYYTVQLPPPAAAEL